MMKRVMIMSKITDKSLTRNALLEFGSSVSAQIAGGFSTQHQGKDKMTSMKFFRKLNPQTWRLYLALFTSAARMRIHGGSKVRIMSCNISESIG